MGIPRPASEGQHLCGSGCVFCGVSSGNLLVGIYRFRKIREEQARSEQNHKASPWQCRGRCEEPIDTLVPEPVGEILRGRVIIAHQFLSRDVEVRSVVESDVGQFRDIDPCSPQPQPDGVDVLGGLLPKRP